MAVIRMKKASIFFVKKLGSVQKYYEKYVVSCCSCWRGNSGSKRTFISGVRIKGKQIVMLIFADDIFLFVQDFESAVNWINMLLTENLSWKSTNVRPKYEKLLKCGSEWYILYVE